MKTLRSILILLAFYSHSSLLAQLPSGSTAPNFTLTDIDGNTHELYDYLDQGRAVLLDFFAVWCGACQYHAPTLEAAYQEYGPDGDNSMVFLALESEDSSSDADCDNYGGFQWSSVLSYPIINSTGSVPSQYGITYYPTVYVVCPDRTITEVGLVEPVALGTFIDANCQVSLYQNDLEVYDISSNVDHCNGDANPIVEVKNVGTNMMTNPIVSLYLDGVLLETVNWLGTLAPNEVEQIQFESLSDLTPGSHTFEAVIGMDENVGNNDLSVGFSLNEFTSTVLSLDLTFDNYPSETSWELLNSSGDVLYSGSAYSAANSTISESFTLEAGSCYSFSIFDSYGDGICCSYGNGSYSLSADGFAIWGGDFDHAEHFSFSISASESEVLSQELFLPEGWSMFSTYMEATNMDLTSILEGIAPQVVIAKDYLGSAYLPDWDYNGIGNVSNLQGYQIKTNAACNFTVSGSYTAPESNPIELVAGWNIISYLRLEAAAADLVFAELNAQGNIVIAKDATGAAYLPDWDFNGIGDLEPGKGYQIKTNTAGVLQYLSNSTSYE